MGYQEWKDRNLPVWLNYKRLDSITKAYVDGGRSMALSQSIGLWVILGLAFIGLLIISGNPIEILTPNAGELSMIQTDNPEHGKAFLGMTVIVLIPFSIYCAVERFVWYYKLRRFYYKNNPR